MAGRVAFVFPGQGSQAPGMGRGLYETLPECRAVFEEADRALGFPLTELCFEGSEADLALTENTQPAILTVSVAAARALAAAGITPHLVAGHSLGEWSALVAVGALEFADAVRLVRSRGRYMQEAVPVGTGAMAAVLGLAPETVEEVCAEAARGETVVAANYNFPEQTVIAGHADAVRRAVAVAEVLGAKRAVMLPVSAPFHSPLMAPARERLRPDLERTRFAELAQPLVTNVDAAVIWKGEEAREALVRQVTAPVRWTECMKALVAEGATTAVEVGPGRVLAGLGRRIDRNVAFHSVEDVASLEKTLTALRALAGGGR